MGETHADIASIPTHNEHCIKALSTTQGGIESTNSPSHSELPTENNEKSDWPETNTQQDKSAPIKQQMNEWGDHVAVSLTLLLFCCCLSPKILRSPSHWTGLLNSVTFQCCTRKHIQCTGNQELAKWPQCFSFFFFLSTD